MNAGTDGFGGDHAGDYFARDYFVGDRAGAGGNTSGAGDATAPAVRAAFAAVDKPAALAAAGKRSSST
ncbi:hypothetical protein [Streptomyces cyslabdanicus]|uniref:hypothetical protein n=1 Tax=Streptomyces cyslabdanicus TaxID=1470456 RepID=UPI0040445E8B